MNSRVLHAVTGRLSLRPPQENVPDFTRWALFQAWCSAMNALGYAIAPHLIDAADHGVPQHRERLFLVLTLGKHPLADSTIAVLRSRLTSKDAK